MNSGFNKIVFPLVLAAILGGCKGADKHELGEEDSILTRLVSSVKFCVLKGECELRDKYAEGGGAPGWGSSVIKDNVRYVPVNSMSISYVDYAIIDVRLLLLPETKIGFKYALNLPSIYPDRNKNNWGGIESSDSGGDSIAWDRKWPLNKIYKIWWQRIVDSKLYKENNTYDKYTSKETHPGSVWCEAVITLAKPLPMIPGHFILHFYPDGHVEGDISALKEDPAQDPRFSPLDNAEQPRFTYDDRMKLPVLKEKYCLKEIPNPYYGLPRPIQMN